MDDQDDEKPRLIKSDTTTELIHPSATVHVDARNLEGLDVETHVQYKLYRRRWIGLAAMAILNLVAAMNWIWFSAISNDTATQFEITLTQVNWLANIVNLVYLPTSLLVPIVIRRAGLRITCLGGAFALLLASWIRYAGAVADLSSDGTYALLMIAQFLSGVAQPVYQILGPKYSETWFDLKQRTTATMLLAMANPIGSALGQLLPPFFNSPKDSVLILGIITSVCCPLAFGVLPQPPTPPTYSGSHPSPPMRETLLALIGKGPGGELAITGTERFDFALLAILFGAHVGVISSFSIFTNQIFAPVGYSSDQAGFFGAALLLAGIIAAVITAPLFDRILTHHLARFIQITVPCLAICWIGMIFAVKPGNEVGIFVLAAIIGILGFSLLPVTLELGCELTRNAETSSAILWFSGNVFTIIFVLSEDALRDDSPPFSMKKGLIMSASLVAGLSLGVFRFTGRQRRRELDVAKNEGAEPRT